MNHIPEKDLRFDIPAKGPLAIIVRTNIHPLVSKGVSVG